VVSSLAISIGIDSCVRKRRRTHSTRRINSSGNRIVASHSARRNCLFADRAHRNDPSHPNRPIQRTKTHTPYPTQPYLVGTVLSITRFHSCCGSRSRSTFCRRSHSSARDAPAAGVAARRRYQAPPPADRSGRTWQLNADDDHGEEQDPDLAMRGQGGSQAAAAPRACACRRWRSSSTAYALTSSAGHQVSRYSAAPS
jgi:hypothetical protein